MKTSSELGFTLIELMITVVVLGILAAIAYPSYTSYVAQARRSDATINLTRLAAVQEKFFTECGSYSPNFNGTISDPIPANRCTGLGAGPTAGLFTTQDGYYTIAITPGNTGALATSFTLTATPAGAQATSDLTKCSTLTINSAGVKTATGTEGGATGGRCWKK